MKPLPTLAEIAKHFPQFELLGCLGRGSMGVVYKARQPKLNRIVALKILAPEKVAEPGFAERFQREAQALARLNHPNIVPVFEFGEAGGLYYLLMEFVDGFSLRQLLQARKISPDVALAIVPKICEALRFAHEQGVVHRDIRPENVLMDYRGRVMIADFGIARIVGESAPEIPSPGLMATLSPSAEEKTGVRGEGLTPDQVRGTPHYLAPEPVADPQTVDQHADIHSAGVVFYEMLTGELPLRGKECSANVVNFPEVDMTFALALSTNMKNTMRTLFRTLKNARVHPVVLAFACLTLLALALATGKITNEILDLMDGAIESAKQVALLR